MQTTNTFYGLLVHAASLSSSDRDLSDLTFTQRAEPPFSSGQRPYELGRSLIVTFSDFDYDDARLAGEDRLTRNFWDKRLSIEVRMG